MERIASNFTAAFNGIFLTIVLLSCSSYKSHSQIIVRQEYAPATLCLNGKDTFLCFVQKEVINNRSRKLKFRYNYDDEKIQSALIDSIDYMLINSIRYEPKITGALKKPALMELISDGTIKLYGMQRRYMTIDGREMGNVSYTYGSGHGSSSGPVIGSVIHRQYFLSKGDDKLTIVSQFFFRHRMKPFFSDIPDFADQLGKDGFHYHFIKEIVIRYNQLKSEQTIEVKQQ